MHLLLHPFAPLVIYSVAASAMMLSYLVGGFLPSREFEVVASLGWTLILVLWVAADARRRHHDLCFDFGLYCYLFYWAVVPGYCFWSRGWRGGLTLMAIVAMCLLPYIVATMVWIYLYG